MTHILICGERGVGKSTLISRLLLENARPVYGFLTRRLEPDETGFHPIYIHAAGEKPLICSKDKLIGTCDAKTHNVNIGVFNALGAELLRSAKPGGVIVMDELGFMEATAERFTQAVFAALDGDIPVIAAVKARFDVPFLNNVRAHPKARVYMLEKSCRETLYSELLPVIAGWNAEAAKR